MKLLQFTNVWSYILICLKTNKKKSGALWNSSLEMVFELVKTKLLLQQCCCCDRIGVNFLMRPEVLFIRKRLQSVSINGFSILETYQLLQLFLNS